MSSSEQITENWEDILNEDSDRVCLRESVDRQISKSFGDDDDDDENDKLNRPNIHAMIHIKQTAMQYAAPANVSCSPGQSARSIDDYNAN